MGCVGRLVNSILSAATAAVVAPEKWDACNYY